MTNTNVAARGEAVDDLPGVESSNVDAALEMYASLRMAEGR